MRKMILIDPNVLESLKKRQHKVVANIEKQLDDTLDTGENVREEVKNYNHYMSQLRLVEDKLKPHIPDSNIENQILESVPLMSRKRTKLLLEAIKPSISWTERGEGIIDSDVKPGSHIVDWIHHALRARKSQPPPQGIEQFIEKVRQLGLPRELVQNPAYHDAPTPKKSRRRRESSPEDIWKSF